MYNKIHYFKGYSKLKVSWINDSLKTSILLFNIKIGPNKPFSLKVSDNLNTLEIHQYTWKIPRYTFCFVAKCLLSLEVKQAYQACFSTLSP